MQMKCRNIKELLVDYLDGKLSTELKEEIEKHLENCESCLDDANQLKNLMGDIYDVEDVIPEDSLRDNFYTMLEREKRKLHRLKHQKRYYHSRSFGEIWTNSPLLQIAAGFALIITGALIGMNLNLRFSTSDLRDSEITALRNDMLEMKQLVMFTLLQQGSASERIKAVSYVNEISQPNDKIIQALVKTLNNDKNANVRLAAANALFQFANNEVVRDSLIEALGTQSDPLIQITLINIMVELEEERSVDYLRKIINSTETLDEVKHNAEKGLIVLL